jgi:hypothetical protein
MRISKVGPVSKIRNPYARRILSNLEGKDPHRVFEAGPRELKKALRGLTAAEMAWRPARGRWPIAWLVHHVCDAEVGLAFRIRLAMGQSGAKFQAFDQDRWAAGLHYGRRSVAASVGLYTALRQSHLELLRLSSGRELRRYGMHEERGKETVERIVHMLAGHDLNHLRQIRSIREQLRGR